MEFKINPLAFSGIFPVPNAVVDDNIRLAGLVQLKVILYMLRHSNDGELNAQKIAKALFIPEEEVKDALVFWLERGVLVSDLSQVHPPVRVEAQPVAEMTEPQLQTRVEEKQKKTVEEINILKPSHEQIAARCQESEDVRTLFREAQSAMGKTIGYDGQSVLLMLYDSYGLPIEVILMAIEYAASMNKMSFAHISRIGRIWSELEIDTIEGANEYIEEHTVVDETWQKLRTMTEITNRNPTEKQRRMLTVWVKEYGYNVDMIYYAYEETIERTGKMSMPYMDKIIRSWHEKGVKTVTDIEAERIKWQTQQQSKLSEGKKAPAKKAEASYDTDAYMRKAINLDFNK